MSPPEHETIVAAIRAARIAAPPDLRGRVLALAAAPPAPPRRLLPWRRTALVLVPACAALAVAGALAYGLASSGPQRRAAPGAVAPQAELSAPDRAVPKAAGGAGAGVPASTGRAQRYEAELTLRVKDLSAATKRTLRLTRGFHGYVRSVDYGSGADRGSAMLVLRVPVGSVQEALVRFSALGTIVDQHVSIRDVQAQLDRRFRQLQALRDSIAKLRARLEAPTLSAAERRTLESRLVATRRRLVALQQAQARERRLVSFATVSLSLRSSTAAVVAQHEPGRIGRAFHRSGEILLAELRVVVYALVVGAPLLLLAGAAAAAARVRRRRLEARLLGRDG
ncbi:MAG TPA: DUF4349 domain-containing protein [Gaiellaceae bacterium]|nr:DUF4349 domain-containing protein [Gaiellaceae bacterium]